MLDPLGTAGESGIVVEVVAATGREDGAVVATAVREHADPAVERRARPALRRQDALVAGAGDGGNGDGTRPVLDEHERPHHIDHRHLDALPFARALSVEQRRGHRSGDGEAADLVGHQCREQHRLEAEPREEGADSTRRLDDVVIRRVVGASSSPTEIRRPEQNTMSGRAATTSSYARRSRARAPGRKLVTMTSAVAAMRKNAARPASCLRSSTTLRLFRIRFIATPDSSACEPDPMKRFVSPTAVSMVMTSAPRSPSVWVARGPITTVLRSSTRTPSSGPTCRSLTAAVVVIRRSSPRSRRLLSRLPPSWRRSGRFLAPSPSQMATNVPRRNVVGPLSLAGIVARRDDEIGP